MGGICKIDAGVLEDWQTNTVYGTGLHCEDELSQWCWRSLGRFTYEERAQLLQFATGSPCVPILGFSRLPGGPFKLERLTNSAKLPMASTCISSIVVVVAAAVAGGSAWRPFS